MQFGGRTHFVQTAERAANPWVRIKASDVENATFISKKRLKTQSRNLERSDVESTFHPLEHIDT
jgi:hypothetical protein